MLNIENSFIDFCGT